MSSLYSQNFEYHEDPEEIDYLREQVMSQPYESERSPERSLVYKRKLARDLRIQLYLTSKKIEQAQASHLEFPAQAKTSHRDITQQRKNEELEQRLGIDLLILTLHKRLAHLQAELRAILPRR